jgi:hypothetical protein
MLAASLLPAVPLTPAVLMLSSTPTGELAPVTASAAPVPIKFWILLATKMGPLPWVWPRGRCSAASNIPVTNDRRVGLRTTAGGGGVPLATNMIHLLAICLRDLVSNVRCSLESPRVLTPFSSLTMVTTPLAEVQAAIRKKRLRRTYDNEEIGQR